MATNENNDILRRPVRITRRRLEDVTVLNERETLSSEAEAAEHTVRMDLRPMLASHALKEGRNHLFTDRDNGHVVSVVYDGASTIQYRITDRHGFELPTKLVSTGGGPAASTKCYICSGTPKTCYEISCEEIVIVHDDD